MKRKEANRVDGREGHCRPRRHIVRLETLENKAGDSFGVCIPKALSGCPTETLMGARHKGA